MEQKPSIGRMVHYVTKDLDKTHSIGQHYPAVMVACYGGAPSYPTNLTVILDGINEGGRAMLHLGSVQYDPDGKPGTWHWPERVE